MHQRPRSRGRGKAFVASPFREKEQWRPLENPELQDRYAMLESIRKYVCDVYVYVSPLSAAC